MDSTSASDPRRRGLLAACAPVALLDFGCAPVAWADARRDHGRPGVAGRPGAGVSVRLVNTAGDCVLDPWQRAEITGWRKGDEEGAAFTPLPDSSAARTGRPQDVGVIGVAVLREAPQVEATGQRPVLTPPRPLPMPRQAGRADSGAKAAGTGQASDAAEADVARPSAPLEARRVAPQPTERLGTGHGERETSVARMTTFERATAQPEQRVEIRDDSHENLAAAGIVPPRTARTPPPHAVPADRPGHDVPDPPSLR